jgi:hypothetical protein
MTKSRKHRAPLSRWISSLFTAALIAGGGLGCQRSADWNSVFHRTEGWRYADGGSSAELPDGRRVWLFGDSVLRHDPGLLYNTIAIQETEPGRAPLPDEIRFFARGESDQLLDVSGKGWDGMRPWVEPRSARVDGRNTWLWPTDVLVSGGQLIAFYSEIGCVHGDFPECRSYLGNLGFLGHTAVVVDNPMDEPEKWRVRTTPLLDRRGKAPSERRLHWGSALLEDGGWLYVFGTGLSAESGPEDVKLARVVPRDVGRYDLWQFLAPDGWRMFPTGPAPMDLESVAHGGATEFSVDRLTRDGQTWLVMVQLDPFARELVVRSSPARDVESLEHFAGPEAGPDVRRFSLPALDPGSKGGVTWSGRAVRRRDSSDDSLFVSYFSTNAASLRFVGIPLSDVRDGW